MIESEVAKHVEKRKQGASDPASEILDSGEDSELEEIGQEEAMMNENLRNSSSHPTEKTYSQLVTPQLMLTLSML